MSRRPKLPKPKHRNTGRSKLRRIRIVLFVVLFGIVGSALLFFSFADQPVNPILPPVTPNPVISEACGGALDIALVADVSGSIYMSEMFEMQSAFTDAVSSLLPGTNSQFSLTEFDSNATVLQPFTNNVSSLDNAIIRLSGGSTTNWTDGLTQGYNTFSKLNATAPKLLIIATDGDPTTPLADAMNEANIIKGAGIHMLAMGLGSDPTVEALEAISGPNVNTGTANTDVVTTAFSSFDAALLAITNTGCGVGGSGNGSGGTGNGNGTGGTGSGTGGTGTGTAGPGTSAAKPTPQPSPSPAPVATVNNQPNPAPQPTAQGTQVKPPKPQPSPFFDGKQYARGSVADTLPITPARQGLAAKWYILFAALILLAGSAGFLVWRKWKTGSVPPNAPKPRAGK